MWCDVCGVGGFDGTLQCGKDSWVSTVGRGWAYRNGEVCGLGAEAEVEDDAPMEAH